MKKLRKNQTQYDVAPLPNGIRAAQFVLGVSEPITPAAAYAAMMDGESEGAAAARQRMIDRHSRPRSATAAEAREAIIRREGGKGSGKV